MSPKKLTTLVNRYLGKSARAVIHERCLSDAKRRLAYSDITVAEIGYALGFEDPNYFSRFFCRLTGLSPGKFRTLAIRSVPAK